jgi:sugar lactone lactonase YvrE
MIEDMNVNGLAKMRRRKVRAGKSLLCVLLAVSSLTPAMTSAFAQDAAPPPARQSPAEREAAGAARAAIQCATITTFGDTQPSAGLTTPVAPPPARKPAAAGSYPIPDAPMLPYQAVQTPPPPVGTRYIGVSDVAVMPNGHLLVFQRSAINQLMEFDTDGKLLRSFGDNIAAQAHGLQIDRHGNIWITDIACNTVTKLSPAGYVLMTIGTKGKMGTWDEASGAHLFNQPNDVAFGPKDDIWVVTGHGGSDPRVLHFDKNGKYLTSWPMKHADGSTATIHSIVLDKKGDLYIADRSANNILVMSQDGKLLRTIHEKNQVGGLFVDKKGGLWMAGGQDGMVVKLDWDGKVTGWTGSTGLGPNQYTEVHYIAVSPDLKTIYVADSLGDRLDKLQRTN